jgi:hypothetical protein
MSETPLPWPVEINLSREAIQHIIDTMTTCPWTNSEYVKTELYNFRNLLHNLLERSEPKPENSDLIGE